MMGDLSGATSDIGNVERYLDEGRQAYIVALGFAGVSDSVRASAWLQRAFELDKSLLEEALTDSDLDSIRDTPDFKTMVGEYEGKA
jgi:hypothetical protein